MGQVALEYHGRSNEEDVLELWTAGGDCDLCRKPGSRGQEEDKLQVGRERAAHHASANEGKCAAVFVELLVCSVSNKIRLRKKS